jgi:putative chitinase
MLRPVDVVARIAPNAKPDYVAAFEAGDAALAAAGIDTPSRLGHFLAQVLHETGRCTLQRESLYYTTTAQLKKIYGEGSGSSADIADADLEDFLMNEARLAERVYGLGNPTMARTLGNTQPGDGFRYRGGGLMQTTGRDAYRRMSIAGVVDFEADPTQIFSAAHALSPAIKEWTDGNLNLFADANCIKWITLKINGGLNGFQERCDLFGEIWPIVSGGAPQPDFLDYPDAALAQTQRDLNRLGAAPSLVVDGKFGHGSATAIAAFQHANGLPESGVPDEQTRAAIQAALTGV